jgi:hypothetical protein
MMFKVRERCVMVHLSSTELLLTQPDASGLWPLAKFRFIIPRSLDVDNYRTIELLQICVEELFCGTA